MDRRPEPGEIQHNCGLSDNRRIYMKSIASSDPKAHSANVREEFQELIQHLRDDVEKIQDAKGQALFETAAEVMSGLETAFKHYEEKSEKAWK
jgi:hypothetical protein